MNPRKTTITILAMLSASIALADDFKTINGKEYKNATVSRVEPDGIVLKISSGISKIYFTELPKEIQERFHYDAEKAAQFTAATQGAISENDAAVAKQREEAEHQRKEDIATQNKAIFGQQQPEQERNAPLQGQRPTPTPIPRKTTVLHVLPLPHSRSPTPPPHHPPLKPLKKTQK